MSRARFRCEGTKPSHTANKFTTQAQQRLHFTCSEESSADSSAKLIADDFTCKLRDVHESSSTMLKLPVPEAQNAALLKFISTFADDLVSRFFEFQEYVEQSRKETKKEIEAYPCEGRH
jgi:hypothetical protein